MALKFMCGTSATKPITLVLLLVMLMVLQTGQALAARKVLTVPEFSQQPYDKICWATASMIIAYFKGDTIDRDVEIAKDKYGSNFNQPAYISDTEYYVRKYTGKAGSIQLNPLTYTAVQYQINNNGPIRTTIWWSNNSGGHAHVIKGYDTSTSYVIYNDPWDSLGHGATYSYYKSNSSWSWIESLFYK
ncbi:MAG: papain-like cysteine protease family protein [Actinomycetota bacterium]|nr:papain-like cysteine protease family protein [Actinomycetota bacterium]